MTDENQNTPAPEKAPASNQAKKPETKAKKPEAPKTEVQKVASGTEPGKVGAAAENPTNSAPVNQDEAAAGKDLKDKGQPLPPDATPSARAGYDAAPDALTHDPVESAREVTSAGEDQAEEHESAQAAAKVESDAAVALAKEGKDLPDEASPAAKQAYADYKQAREDYAAGKNQPAPDTVSEAFKAGWIDAHNEAELNAGEPHNGGELKETLPPVTEEQPATSPDAPEGATQLPPPEAAPVPVEADKATAPVEEAPTPEQLQADAQAEADRTTGAHLARRSEPLPDDASDAMAAGYSNEMARLANPPATPGAMEALAEADRTAKARHDAGSTGAVAPDPAIPAPLPPGVKSAAEIEWDSGVKAARDGNPRPTVGDAAKSGYDAELVKMAGEAK